MAAISSLLLATIQQGDHIVASNRLYGKTSQLIDKHLARFGVQATFVDIGDFSQVRQALKMTARLFFVETMSNPLLQIADVDTLAGMAHEHACLLAVDNTFATPVLLQPLEHGADLVVESLTKMIGGHSDVTLGVVCGRADLGLAIPDIVSTWGLAANPFDCWLAARGLATLSLRMHAASANAAALADWLVAQPGVTRVLYPGRPDHPDYKLACRLLGSTFGNMLYFELEGGREAVNRFMRLARGIPFSPSLGDTATTCSHPATTSHRHFSKEARDRMGIGEGLVRLSVGVEALDGIKQKMAAGLV